jgi:hypothetical protein
MSRMHNLFYLDSQHITFICRLEAVPNIAQDGFPFVFNQHRKIYGESFFDPDA